MKDEEEQEWTKGSTAELTPAKALFLRNYVVEKELGKRMVRAKLVEARLRTLCTIQPLEQACSSEIEVGERGDQ
jgi:hypothetical protein